MFYIKYYVSSNLTVYASVGTGDVFLLILTEKKEEESGF